MIIKKKFELIYKSSGDVLNVPNISKSTLKAFKIPLEDSKHLVGVVKAFGRSRNYSTNKIIDDNLSKCIIVNMPDYPICGFVTKGNYSVINTSIFSYSNVTDIPPGDMYVMFLYVSSLRKYFEKKPFKNADELVANMIFSIFMKLFGKKSGLIGAYRDLIPKLQYLIRLYVQCSMLGMKNDELLRKKLGGVFFIDYRSLNLDYDFSSILGFLKAVRNNDIIPISENRFSTSIINVSNISNLPMFEDIGRFFATILCSNIKGNSLFPFFWAKCNQTLFKNLSSIALLKAK